MRENSLNDQIDAQGRQERGGGKKEMASLMSPRFLAWGLGGKSWGHLLGLGTHDQKRLCEPGRLSEGT